MKKSFSRAIRYVMYHMALMGVPSVIVGIVPELMSRELFGYPTSVGLTVLVFLGLAAFSVLTVVMLVPHAMVHWVRWTDPVPMSYIEADAKMEAGICFWKEITGWVAVGCAANAVIPLCLGLFWWSGFLWVTSLAALAVRGIIPGSTTVLLDNCRFRVAKK